MTAKNKKLTPRYLVGVLVAVCCCPAWSNNLTTKIADGVTQYLHKSVSDFQPGNAPAYALNIQTQSIDPRLQLAPCTTPMTYSMNSNTQMPGRALVKVGCKSPQATWSIYVSATVSWEQDIVVATVGLRRGQDITSNDVRIERRRLHRPGVKYVHALSQVVGKAAGRRIAANKAVDWRFLEQADLVRKGETVQLMAKNASIAVKIEGKALTSGAKGEQIRVRNPLSNRIVDARVTSRGRAEVAL
ncbi:MAG: flagellar basal body P-ring formation chaperone FlgA [Pseudomonadota bacterium]